MKKNEKMIQLFDSMDALTMAEMERIEGGSVWRDLAFLAGLSVRCFKEITQITRAYESSTPSYLLK